jgi:hypothetical protein
LAGRVRRAIIGGPGIRIRLHCESRLREAGADIRTAVALLAVGGGIGVLNGRSLVRSGLRQVVVGGLAAAVTFGVGHLLGACIA